MYRNRDIGARRPRARVLPARLVAVALGGVLTAVAVQAAPAHAATAASTRQPVRPAASPVNPQADARTQARVLAALERDLRINGTQVRVRRKAGGVRARGAEGTGREAGPELRRCLDVGRRQPG